MKNGFFRHNLLLPLLLVFSLTLGIFNVGAESLTAASDESLITTEYMSEKASVTEETSENITAASEESSEEGTTEEETTTLPVTSEAETTVAESTSETTVETTENTTAASSEHYSQSTTTLPSPTSVSLNISQVTLGKGETLSLKATVNEGADAGKIKYTSSDETVATVSSDGKITAVKEGVALINASCSSSVSAACTVTVLPAANKISISQAAITLGLGESFTFKSTIPEGTAAYKRTYSCVRRGILSDLGNGNFRADKIGVTFVTVKTFNGASAQCKVTVLPAAHKVTLNKTSITLGLGESFDFNASVPSATAAYMKTYSCNDTSVLSYKGSGIFKALKPGTSTVSVKIFNGKTATCKVTVLPAPTKVSLNATTLTLGLGESFDFNVSLPSGTAAYLKTMSCSNSSVLAYKGAGVYTATKVGTATVTVKIFNGKTASCKVTVLPAPTSISSASSSYTLSQGSKKQSSIVCATGTACNTYTYKSSNSSIAYCDAKGVIYARKMGTATITATSFNGKKCSFSVTVNSMGIPFVSQAPDYPTGCEAASCTQLLKYYGYSISLDDMVDTIPRKSIYYVNGKRYGPDINEYFVGNPAGGYTSSEPGYGAFSPCVTKALQTAIDERGGKHTATRISGCSFDTLLSHISAGRPAIVWATYLMQIPSTVNSWYITETGKYFEYPRGTHVMVLTGYSDSTVTIVDPYEGTVVFDIDTFEARWNLLGKQAIVLK